jgi:hypothetical protein
MVDGQFGEPYEIAASNGSRAKSTGRCRVVNVMIAPGLRAWKSDNLGMSQRVANVGRTARLMMELFEKVATWRVAAASSVRAFSTWAR